MEGKVFVIEAGDGSGKATQTEKLYNRLASEKYQIKKIEFPNYNSNSSALIKMYLNGEFGDKPEDVNPFVASTFFAADRFASFNKEWKQFYLDGGLIIADRYTTSNMVHQASKIADHKDKEEFLQWLWDFEFVKFKLPVPNCVIFLDMPPEYSQQLMLNRNNKFTGDSQKDIHEKDDQYLIESYKTSCMVAEKYGWKKVRCIREGSLRSIEDIHEEIYQTIKPFLSDSP